MTVNDKIAAGSVDFNHNPNEPDRPTSDPNSGDGRQLQGF